MYYTVYISRVLALDFCLTELPDKPKDCINWISSSYTVIYCNIIILHTHTHTLTNIYTYIYMYVFTMENTVGHDVHVCNTGAAARKRFHGSTPDESSLAHVAASNGNDHSHSNQLSTNDGEIKRPLLIEVAGYMEDVTIQDVVARLRRYRSQYSHILRIISTLIASCVGEDVLFGPTDSLAETQTLSPPMPLLRQPRWAISVEKVFPLVRRVNGDDCSSSINGTAITETTANCIDGKHVPTGDASSKQSNTKSVGNAQPRQHVIDTVEDFMAYRCFPGYLTRHMWVGQSCMSNNGGVGVAVPLVTTVLPRWIMRHYADEASRLSSFLIADEINGAAALVDPGHDAAVYIRDVETFNLSLRYIIVTHCYVNTRLGVDGLIGLYPNVQVVSGWPLRAAGHRQHIALSDTLRLCAIAVPSYSPECIIVELHAHGKLASVFCGSVWSPSTLLCPATDEACAATRSSENTTNVTKCIRCAVAGLGMISPTPSNELARAAQQNLKSYLYDTYFSHSRLLCIEETKKGQMNSDDEEEEKDDNNAIHADTLQSSAAAPHECYDDVLMFVSPGGANIPCNPLDRYWVLPISDILRIKHTNKIVQSLRSIESYSHLRKSVSTQGTITCAQDRNFNFDSLYRAVSTNGLSLDNVVCYNCVHTTSINTSDPQCT